MKTGGVLWRKGPKSETVGRILKGNNCAQCQNREIAPGLTKCVHCCLWATSPGLV
ncbi:hypothetical protein T4B_4971 [Trichinella pseudospiralis]|uniref:Uncharacterized protein n=1 Tax=Trichinella pseudospiralis TaxID=6337 RepID=A0A0V1GIC7_TRIPS|nr:hypothetical protein T4B_4971 [Trichinella pseudospiralis]